MAKRVRGVPRTALRLLEIVRKTALVEGYGSELDEDVVEYALEIEDVDSIGLTSEERAYLTVLAERFQGGPVGVVNLAAALGEDESTIKQIERYLIQAGMIAKINRGRLIRETALRHLGYPVPEDFKEAA